jgi:hypothetical protein
MEGIATDQVFGSIHEDRMGEAKHKGPGETREKHAPNFRLAHANEGP